MQVLFEAGVIYDVAKKANTVAPVKGAEYSRAAGTLLEIRPDQDPSITVKATNTLVYYLEWINAVSFIEPRDANWRIPSALLSTLLGSFSLDASSIVTFTVRDEAPGILEIQCKKSITSIRLMDADAFPSFQPFDPTGLKEAKNFAARFNQVAWAASNDRTQGAIAGVHVDGETLRATDRYQLASVPCIVPVDSAITLPPEVMAPLLRDTEDVDIAAYDGKFYMMPDETTQITSVTLDGAFPDMSKLKRDMPETIQLSTLQVKAAIDRMMILVGGSDRFPRLEVTLGNELMKLRLSSQEVGQAVDEIDLPGMALHDPWVVNFLPKYLLGALTHASSDVISFSYDPTVARCLPYIKSAPDYEAWVAPRKEQAPGVK